MSLTRVRWLKGACCLTASAVLALVQAQNSAAFFPYYLSGKYDSQSRKWSGWLLDESGKALYNSSGAQGEPLTKIDFKWIEDFDDSSPRNLSISWNNVKLLSEGLNLPLSFHDALNLFQGFNKSYSVSYGLRKSWAPFSKSAGIRFDGGLEANFSRDDQGVVANTGQIALEAKFATIPIDPPKASELYTKLMRRNGITYTRGSFRSLQADLVRKQQGLVDEAVNKYRADHAAEMVAMDASAKVAAEALVRSKAQLEIRATETVDPDIAAVFAALHPESSFALAAKALPATATRSPAVLSLQVSSDSKPALSALKNLVEGVTETQAFKDMQGKINSPTELQLMAVEPSKAMTVRAIESLMSASQVLEVFAKGEGRIQSDTNMPFNAITFWMDRNGVDKVEPPAVFYLQSYGWVKEDRKAKGYASATITWKFGKPNTGGDVRPGFLASYLIGTLPTGTDYKKGLFSVGFVIPLR